MLKQRDRGSWQGIGAVVNATMILALALVLTPSKAAGEESLYDQIRARGVFNAGVRYDYPPYGYIDKQNEPAGFGPAIAKEIAKRLGVKVNWVQVTSENRIPLVTGGHIDAEIGGTTETVQRNQVIDFTIPYVWDGVTILVRKDSGLTDIKQLQPPRVASTTRGSNNIPIFMERVPTGKMTLFDDYNQAALALKLKKVDAVVLNYTVGVRFAAQEAELRVGNRFWIDPIGIGIRQNDSRWRNWLNFTLQQMWQDGTYQRLHKAEIGAEPDTMLFSEKTLQPGIEKWDGKP